MVTSKPSLSSIDERRKKSKGMLVFFIPTCADCSPNLPLVLVIMGERWLSTYFE
jgi:hypothetical protein